MDRLMELEMDSDQLDRVLETLDAYGVSVVNDASDDTVRISDDQAADVAAATASAICSSVASSFAAFPFPASRDKLLINSPLYII